LHRLHSVPTRRSSDLYDLSPLFRSTVGFDRLARLMDTATRFDESAPSYPPYNIEKTGENAYRITMAVAGFAEDEIEITAQDNTLDRKSTRLNSSHVKS